jgi:hypothetical protein
VEGVESASSVDSPGGDASASVLMSSDGERDETNVTDFSFSEDHVVSFASSISKTPSSSDLFDVDDADGEVILPCEKSHDSIDVWETADGILPTVTHRYKNSGGNNSISYSRRSCRFSKAGSPSVKG